MTCLQVEGTNNVGSVLWSCELEPNLYFTKSGSYEKFSRSFYTSFPDAGRGTAPGMCRPLLGRRVHETGETEGTGVSTVGC